MNKSEFNPKFDRNWTWPEKTWFRERLNTLRAQQEQAHRKPMCTRKDAVTIQAKPVSDRESEEG